MKGCHSSERPLPAAVLRPPLCFSVGSPCDPSLQPTFRGEHKEMLACFIWASHLVAHAALELTAVLLPQSVTSCDYRCVPLCPEIMPLWSLFSEVRPLSQLGILSVPPLSKFGWLGARAKSLALANSPLFAVLECSGARAGYWGSELKAFPTSSHRKGSLLCPAEVAVSVLCSYTSVSLDKPPACLLHTIIRAAAKGLLPELSALHTAVQA